MRDMVRLIYRYNNTLIELLCIFAGNICLLFNIMRLAGQGNFTLSVQLIVKICLLDKHEAFIFLKFLIFL